MGLTGALIERRDLVAFADEVGGSDAVAVEGSRTRWTAGGEPHAGVRLVRAPSGVSAYLPEEMVVCVGAGTTVAELTSVLAASGQRSALPERGGTVGGAIAVGEQHLDVLGRGSLRASVLEVRYASAEGRLVRGGGPTVKNVTGYDLPRLVTGSLGTLGLIAEVILRTNPVPTTSTWWRAEEADPFEVFQVLLRPSSVWWDGNVTWVHLEGHAGDVAAQARALTRFASFTEVDGRPSLPPHRWSLEPSALRELQGRFVASIGVGLVFRDEPQPQRSPDATSLVVAAQVKREFDPNGRLNPGRDPARRP